MIQIGRLVLVPSIRCFLEVLEHLTIVNEDSSGTFTVEVNVILSFENKNYFQRIE